MDTILNLLIVLLTAVSFLFCFWKKEGGWSIRNGRRALRFFTILSNLFSALASLAALFLLQKGSLPYGIWLIKYIATASVTVTFLTVMVFLGPTLGYKSQLEGWSLYLHLLGPLFAVVSFCFLERFYTLSFPASLWGIVPVLLYGALYLKKVVYTSGEAQWDDFYGFNKNGAWKKSFSAMVVGAFLICMLLFLLCKI